MYRQHKKLAKVWTTLQGRHDIASILREIIGKHAVDSLGREEGSHDVETSIQSIIWIKTILDWQRALLSGTSTGVAECPPHVLPYMLPSELLLSTIFYLVDIKTRAFPSQTTLITREFRRPRLILTQTLLSALRLLLLGKDSLNAYDKRRLRVAINAAWQHDRLHGVEEFIVSRVFAEVLDSVNAATTENPYQRELSLARLPTYASGLYPLDIRPEVFVEPLIHGTMEDDWIDAYWVLFDCLWAAEIAVTQRIVDLDKQNEGTNPLDSWLDTDEILEQLYHQRSSLILSIFHVPGPMTPDPELLVSLAITLLEWNEDLDSFLSRQDSFLQQRSGFRTIQITSGGYGKNIIELSPYFNNAMASFSDWLAARTSNDDRSAVRSFNIAPHDTQYMVKDWISRISSTDSETVTKGMKGSLAPYVVDCPKLHVVPKELLAYKLRWCDKWAFEAIQGNSPTVHWKEGVQCPSCSKKANIKHARLIEPLHQLTASMDHSDSNDSSLGSHSTGTSSSYELTSSSSQSVSVAKNSSLSALPVRLQPTQEIEDGSQLSAQPPCYSVSPIDSTFSIGTRQSVSQGSSFVDYPVSPLNESLNIPIPIEQRLSMDLPIPVVTPAIPDNSSDKIPVPPPSESTSITFDTSSQESPLSYISASKMKSPSRTARFADFSLKRKPTLKSRPTEPLPPDAQFAFSASGHSLLLWGKFVGSIVRFDIPSNDPSAIQGCRYDVTRVEAAACGNHKCAVLATSDLQQHRLFVFDGINTTPKHETVVDFQGRITDVCLAVSRNDDLAAISVNDEILIYRLNEGLTPVSFQHQIQVYEMRGGISHRRTIPVGRTSSDDSTTHRQKVDTGRFGGITSREAAEEQRRQSAIVSRRLCFSPDSTHLVVATQLGDHCVYVDVWDCTEEPVCTISEHSRSFRLPPWTLNDGDLTSVFYDSFRRCAVVTAFLGKEYPVLIPFPGTGHDTLQNETYSTKIVHAAQSASGIFVALNAMTEIVQFEFSTKGLLSPRRLKRASRGIPNSAFKPGAICLAMPVDNIIQCFWIKDQKCMLRTVHVATGETVSDFDLREQFDRLMGLKGQAVIKRAESLMIPELGG